VMIRSAVAVLGEPLRVDLHVVQPGQRLLEEKGPALETWRRIWSLLGNMVPAKP
jgi:hypothetical protein